MSPQQVKKKWFVLIDLGHGNCRLALVPHDYSDLLLYEEPTTGIIKGKVADRDALTASIQKLAQRAGLYDLNYEAYVNIPANQSRALIQTINHKLNGTYRSSDYEAIIDMALESASLGLDEVIDVIPLQLRLDGKLADPLAFGTVSREANMRLMMATHPSVLLEDVLSCLNGAGITVSEFRSNGLAVSRALQYLRASAENSVLLDFGHSTITGSLMVGGVVNQFFCVPAGSAHITKDLCAGLGTSFEDAELIKIDLNISETANSNFKSSRAAHYAIPRVTELMTLAFKNFALYRRSLDGGLLFCGGGSSLTGLVEYCAQKFGVKGPLIAQLNGDGAKVFVGISTGVSSQNHPSPALTLDSSWIALLAQARALVRLRRAISSEKDARPLSRLRPLWTWLSELSR